MEKRLNNTYNWSIKAFFGQIKGFSEHFAKKWEKNKIWADCGKIWKFFIFLYFIKTYIKIAFQGGVNDIFTIFLSQDMIFFQYLAFWAHCAGGEGY